MNGTFLLFCIVAFLILVMGAYVRTSMKQVPENISRVEVKVDEVHRLVNSRLSSVLDRVEQLTETLQASNVEIPDDPAHPPIK